MFSFAFLLSKFPGRPSLVFQLFSLLLCSLLLLTAAGFAASSDYTPGVLEMLESLINPAKYDQTSVAWTVEVPERHVGQVRRRLYLDLRVWVNGVFYLVLFAPPQDYWVVAIELLKSGAAPMGLLRAPPSDGGTPLPYGNLITQPSKIVLYLD